MAEAYLGPILSAVLWFPLLAAGITLPFALYQYHRYGAIPWLRTPVVYSFVFYLMAAYFLVILPLPDKSDPSLFSLAHHFEPLPFNNIAAYIQTHGIPGGLGGWKAFFTSMTFLQLAFNVLMTLPFGVYLRYYFKRGFLHTLLAGFALSLFFELTQITALYGIYPAPYRTFDADDLICNTLGAVLGYLVAPGLLFFMPRREQIDADAVRASVKVTLFRRCCATIVDLGLVYGAVTAAELVLLVLAPKRFATLPGDAASGASLYFFNLWVCGLVSHGYTPGKRLCHLRVAAADGSPVDKGRLTLRYLIVYIQLCGFLLFTDLTQALFPGAAGLLRFVLTLAELALCVFCLSFFFEFAGKVLRRGSRPFRYERWSGTTLISDFVVTEQKTPAPAARDTAAQH